MDATMTDPTSLSDADLWEHYRQQGLSVEAATHHVVLRNMGRQTESPASTAIDAISPAASAVGNYLDQAGLKTGRVVSGLARLAVTPTGSLGAMGDAYNAGESSYDANLAALDAAHPSAAAGGAVAGLVLNPLSLLGAPVVGAGTGARMLQGAKVGGLIGGIQGLAGGEGSPRERLGQGAEGAAMGGLIGASIAPSVGRSADNAALRQNAVKQSQLKTQLLEQAVARRQAPPPSGPPSPSPVAPPTAPPSGPSPMPVEAGPTISGLPPETESALRMSFTKMGKTPDQITQILQTHAARSAPVDATGNASHTMGKAGGVIHGIIGKRPGAGLLAQEMAPQGLIGQEPQGLMGQSPPPTSFAEMSPDVQVQAKEAAARAVQMFKEANPKATRAQIEDVARNAFNQWLRQ